MNRFKAFANDFPTLGSAAIVAQTLIFFTGVAVIGRLAWGEDFPDGYDSWLIFLGLLATGTFSAMIGKRFSDFRYRAAKPQPPSVNVESAGTVRAEGDVNVGKREEG